jgi:hypothetical protein
MQDELQKLEVILDKAIYNECNVQVLYRSSSEKFLSVCGYISKKAETESYVVSPDLSSRFFSEKDNAELEHTLRSFIIFSKEDVISVSANTSFVDIDLIGKETKFLVEINYNKSFSLSDFNNN